MKDLMFCFIAGVLNYLIYKFTSFNTNLWITYFCFGVTGLGVIVVSAIKVVEKVYDVKLDGEGE